MVNTKDITQVFTLQSMYDNNSIAVYIDDTEYRIKREDLLIIINNSNMTFEKYTPRKHTYLKPTQYGKKN